MTNTEIIFTNMVELINKGIITEDNIIHTYQHWKALGYKVKKGETAVAKFPIWKYTKKKNTKNEELTEEEAQKQGYCFMKNSAWFTEKQVEKLA